MATPSTVPIGQRQEWLAPEEVVAELKLTSVQTLYSWRRRGVGPEALKVGVHLRYSREAVDRWVTQLQEQQRSERPGS